jgi:hypothetical protein
MGIFKAPARILGVHVFLGPVFFGGVSGCPKGGPVGGPEDSQQDPHLRVLTTPLRALRHLDSWELPLGPRVLLWAPGLLGTPNGSWDPAGKRRRGYSCGCG